MPGIKLILRLNILKSKCTEFFKFNIINDFILTTPLIIQQKNYDNH
jgi:hypothetical protein